MNLNLLLREQRTLLRPSADEEKLLTRQASAVIKMLNSELKKAKVEGRPFIGGSFAKGTLVKKREYDIDIFVRVKKIDSAVLIRLERVVQTISKTLKLPMKKIHGSRDYFQLSAPHGVFEIIPVLAISKPSHAENVTDLSYFHVAYVQKKLRGLMADEVRLAKQFCQAQGVYGAESYIRGFSGYGLECLIIHYKSFLALLKGISKYETILLDPAKHYKNPIEARLSLNEAKRQSPIVLVDPTHKERNVLAALSVESFNKLQKAAKSFLARPSALFFEEKTFNERTFRERAHSQGRSVLAVLFTTDRQEGDIAGTKLKKVASYIMERLAERFTLHNYHFDYSGDQTARLFVSYNPKQMLERRGPLVTMASACSAFKKHHPRAFVKKGRLWAQVPASEPIEKVLREITSHHEQMYNMGLTEMGFI